MQLRSSRARAGSLAKPSEGRIRVQGRVLRRAEPAAAHRPSYTHRSIEEPNAHRCDDRTHATRGHNTIRQVVDETKADPCNVQEARGQNKTCAVADGVGCGREFLAVRVTVKYREHCDNDRGSPYRC